MCRVAVFVSSPSFVCFVHPRCPNSELSYRLLRGSGSGGTEAAGGNEFVSTGPRRRVVRLMPCVHLSRWAMRERGSCLEIGSEKIFLFEIEAQGAGEYGIRAGWDDPGTPGYAFRSPGSGLLIWTPRYLGLRRACSETCRVGTTVAWLWFPAWSGVGLSRVPQLMLRMIMTICMFHHYGCGLRGWRMGSG